MYCIAIIIICNENDCIITYIPISDIIIYKRSYKFGACCDTFNGCGQALSCNVGSQVDDL